MKSHTLFSIFFLGLFLSLFPQFTMAEDILSARMEAGSVTTEEGVGVTLESGSVASVNGSTWTPVLFQNTGFVDPVVVVTHLQTSNTTPVSVRIRNVTAQGFEVLLQSPDGSIPLAETVYFVAVERGKWFINGYKIEAESTTTNIVGSSPVINGSWKGKAQTYQHHFARAPIVLHQVQTANDESWITSWVSKVSSQFESPTSTGFQIAMNGAQAVTQHGEETIGWIAVEADASGSIGGVSFETKRKKSRIRGYEEGCTSLTYQTINSKTAIPVISQMEMDGGDGSWSVLCDVESTFVSAYVEEDTVHDKERSHTTELTGSILFSAPAVTNLTEQSGWKTVQLQQSYTSPVVVTLARKDHTLIPATTRIRNVTSTSFDVALQSPNGALGFIDTVYYLVVEEGVWKMKGAKIEAHKKSISTLGFSGALNGKWRGESQSYTHSYDADPIVLHQVMSFDDADWVTSWVSKREKPRQPNDMNGFQIGMNGAQATTEHDAETMGWIVVEAAKEHTYASVPFTTVRKINSVGGYDNGCAESTFEQSYKNPIIVGAQLEMGGGDGSWLQICDLGEGFVGLQVDEDQEQSREREHLPESVGYVIFKEAFFADGSEEEEPLCYEIGGDGVSNDGDALVDEFNTLKDNCVHPTFGTHDPRDTKLPKDSIRKVRKARKGKVFVTYTDGAVYRYNVYGTRSRRKTKVRLYAETGLLVVTDPFAKRVALLNAYNGKIFAKQKLFRNHNKRKYKRNFLALSDTQKDGSPEVIVVGKRAGYRIRVSVVRVNVDRKRFAGRSTRIVWDQRVRPKQTQVEGNRILLRNKKRIGRVLYTLSVDNKYDIRQ